MNANDLSVVALMILGTIFSLPAFSQSDRSGGNPRSPRWFLVGSAPDPGGRLPVLSGGKVVVDPGGGTMSQGGFLTECADDATKFCASQAGFGMRPCLNRNSAKLSGACKAALSISPTNSIPSCGHSPVCDNRYGGTRQQLQRVEWEETMGYTYAYPIDLPVGGGGVSAVGITSKSEFWVFQRNAVGKPQLFKFDPNYKLLLAIGDDVIGHQEKAHGLAVDRRDNIWICDANGSTVEKISPDGKLLMTLGVRGHRGDWNEARGQRLLWQPLDLAFAPNGDIYIGEGHANESPNDADSDDPTNNIGAARVIHLDEDGKFINQWYGNSVGQGKFSMVHGLAVDPRNGDVWIGDREQYRLVVYTGDGKFVKTVQMRNLTCAVAFDPLGNLWVASGQDGQVLKIDQNGNVLGAVGRGSGLDTGQFIETNYLVWDRNGNLYTGDTVPVQREMER